MTFNVVYLNNDNDIFLKKCAFIKRLQKDSVLYSDRLISPRTGIIFITVSESKAREIIANNKDLLKLHDTGTKQAIVIA